MIRLGAGDARRILLAATGLGTDTDGAGSLAGQLDRLRCIQLDPLDPIGTNADLVALARVRGIRRGAVHRHLMPGQAFEHFAKERCVLPARAFPYYRDQAVQTPWWRLHQRLKRLDAAQIQAVLDEVEARGPVTAADLSDHGRVEALDWSGWKGTGKAATMALEVLWTRCQVVVCGRRGRQRVYDTPARALPDWHDAPAAGPFGRWALLERAAAAGLLARATGPWWSMLREVRTDGTVETLLEEGALTQVVVEGSRRAWLVRTETLEAPSPDDDGRMRILGPLDPLIWNRDLVRQVFGFDYVWEVYKPAAKRRWGWYVCPLLHHGQLVGRIQAKVLDGRLHVERVWREHPAFDETALSAAVLRHAVSLGVEPPVL